MVEIRGVTPAVGAAVTALDDTDDDELPGNLAGEEVVAEKDVVQLAEEALDTLGDEYLSDEIESELNKEDRRISEDEDALKAGVDDEDEADDPPGAPSDALRRKAEIEALGRELKQKGLKSPGDVLHHVRDNLGERDGERGPNKDPTLQYGALSLMEEMFAAQGDKEMAAAVGAAATQLLAENATEINKGVAVSEAAAVYASERSGTPSDLRTLYMREVVAHKSITASFTGVMDKYGPDGFGDALGFLLRAAGDDLARMPASAERVQQKEVIDDLYQLEVLHTMHARTGSALKVLGRSYAVAPEMTPQRVMKDTFAMIERPVQMGEAGVTRLASDAVPESIEGRIAFLREYRTLAAMIPIRVFDEADSGASGGLRLRERLTDAIVAAQDVADAEEQAKLGS